MERFSKAYEILGLTHEADIRQVKKAYRKLAFLYHPDINPKPDAQERFLIIKKAYDVIITADKTWNQAAEEQLIRKSRHPKDRGRTDLTKAEAIRIAREKVKRYEAMQLQREARQFARFKRSVLYPWTMAMSYVSLIFFLLIIVDTAMVNVVHTGFVMDKEPVTFSAFGVQTTAGYRLRLSNGEDVLVGMGPGNRIGVHSHVSLAETMIFRDIPKIHVVNQDFRAYELSGFNKPPYLFFLLFIAVPVLIFFVDKPSAVFYSAGAFARYFVLIFIVAFLIF